MTAPRPPWTATVRIAAREGELARWLERALAPEARREVPRSRAELRRRGRVVELRIVAADAGAMRAAMNTFLGWVALSLATVAAAQGKPPSAGAPAEALISRSR